MRSAPSGVPSRLLRWGGRRILPRNNSGEWQWCCPRGMAFGFLARPCAVWYQPLWFHIWSCDAIGPSAPAEQPAAAQGFASGADQTHFPVSDEWPDSFLSRWHWAVAGAVLTCACMHYCWRQLIIRQALLNLFWVPLVNHNRQISGIFQCQVFSISLESAGYLFRVQFKSLISYFHGDLEAWEEIPLWEQQSSVLSFSSEEKRVEDREEMNCAVVCFVTPDDF